MNDAKKPLPVMVRCADYETTTPFDGDLFGRSKLAERLTNLLQRLRAGCVIGLDAPWGEGKTWFGKHWKSALTAQGFRTIYVDAFERDYLEDPFVLLSSEIVAAIDPAESGLRKSLLDASVSLGKTLLPLAAKLSVNTAGRFLLGTANLANEVSDAAKDASADLNAIAERLVSAQLENAEAEKQSVDHFRNALRRFATDQDKPVVFFIDELDRCRPDFAVRIIERAKHFFDVPNLVFVLLLNRAQLERSVQGIYGQAFDANAYLGKFVHLYFSLPRQLSHSRSGEDHNRIYLIHVLGRYGFDNTQRQEAFVDTFAPLASAFDLSLRDIEKAVSLLAMANVDATMDYLAWPIVLKLKFPDIFSNLAKGATKGHQSAEKALMSSGIQYDESWCFGYFLALHKKFGRGIDALNDQDKKALEDYKPELRFRLADNPLPFWLRRLDVTHSD